MKFLGINDDVIDCRHQQNLNNRIYEFCMAQDDYFANIFLRWDRIQSDVYQLKIDGYSFEIGAGFYVFVGDYDHYDGDWVLIDEVIGRDLGIFNVAPNFSRWGFGEHNLEGIYPSDYFYPNTKNIIPVVSSCGSSCIMTCSVDPSRSQYKDMDFYSSFIL